MELIELGSILHMTKGKKPAVLSPEPKDGYLPYVDIEAFETGIIKKYSNGENCVPCEDGDLLIVCDGSRSGLVGRAIKGYVGSTLAKIKADELSNDYLYRYVQGKYILLNTNKKGTGTPHLKAELLKAQKLVVPDSEEQSRIVSRVDELLSQLDEGVDTLLKTQEQLEVYRLAVLKEAFDGKYVPGAEAELDNKPIQVFAKVETGATPLKSNTAYYGGTIPWVSSGKVNDEYICEATDYITNLALTETNCKVFPSGTLLVAMYGEGKTRGKCAELAIDAATNQALAAICIFDNDNVDKDYLKWYLTFNYQNLRRKAVGGVQPNLNLDVIKNMQIPLVSFESQKKTVEQIESRISVYDSISSTIETTIIQTQAMRQSVLKQAFEGRL